MTSPAKQRKFAALLSWAIGFSLSLLLAPVGLAKSQSLEAIQIQTNRQTTTITLRLSRLTKPHTFLLFHPPRFVVDLSNTGKAFKHAPARAKSPIRSVRLGVRHGKNLRLVFDLKTPQQLVGSKTIKQSHGGKIVLTLKPAKIKKIASPHQKKKQPKLKSHSKPLRPVRIIIDPGHGGKDPGAIGRRRTYEKDVVLAIAKRLNRLIERDPNMQATLTRRGDYYVGLRKRLDIARKADGDLFVAVHADAFKNPHSRGASIYALSSRGASSEAARWLAAKENYSELGGIDLKNKSNILRSVLIDLSQTATISTSLQLGETILNNISHITKLHNHRVEQAPFVVLKSPDIPSLLIETGFISNPREESKLKNPRFQQRLAKAIYQGIRRYFETHPLPGTHFQKLTKHVLVKKGDTLSALAKRYNRTIHALKRANDLKHNTIRQGEILKIPPPQRQRY